MFVTIRPLPLGVTPLCSMQSCSSASANCCKHAVSETIFLCAVCAQTHGHQAGKLIEVCSSNHGADYLVMGSDPVKLVLFLPGWIPKIHLHVFVLTEHEMAMHSVTEATSAVRHIAQASNSLSLEERAVFKSVYGNHSAHSH